MTQHTTVRDSVLVREFILKPYRMLKIDNTKDYNVIDTSIVPDIYRTNNPEYFNKLCIDFQPYTVPTIASFETLHDVKRKLIEMFGKEQWVIWFPNGIAEKKDDGTIDRVS